MKRGVSILNWEIPVDLIKMLFEQRLERGEHMGFRRKSIIILTASAKV